MHEREPSNVHYPERLTFLDLVSIHSSTEYIYNHSSESVTIQERQSSYKTGSYITKLTEISETERATGTTVRPAIAAMTFTDDMFVTHGYNINFYIDGAANESSAAYISPYSPSVVPLDVTTNIGFKTESLLLSLADQSDETEAACKALIASVTEARVLPAEVTIEQMLELSPISEVSAIQNAFRLALDNCLNPTTTTVRHTLCAPNENDRLYITYFDEESELDRLITHSVATETGTPIDITLLVSKDTTVCEVLQPTQPHDPSDDRPYYARVADHTTMVTRKAAYHDVCTIQAACAAACSRLQGKS